MTLPIADERLAELIEYSSLVSGTWVNPDVHAPLLELQYLRARDGEPENPQP